MKIKCLQTLAAIALLSVGTAIASLKTEFLQEFLAEAIAGEAAYILNRKELHEN